MTSTFTITGVATDEAGATSSISGQVTVVPLQNPTISMALSPVMPSGGYLAGTHVTVTFTASDPNSLPVTVTASVSGDTSTTTHVLSPVVGTPGAFTFVA